MSHPKYADMILAAVKALGGKGASRQAINKYVVKEYHLTENKHHHAMLNQALKRCSAPKGALVHSKGKGAAGSFKLRAAVPEPKASAAKPKQAKEKTAKKLPKKAAEKPKEAKNESKPVEAPASPSKPKSPTKAKKIKKSKAASPKKPKAVKAKKTPKKSTAKIVAFKK